MIVVIDAAVIIDYLRRIDTHNTLYAQLIHQDVELIISLVTVAELYSGKRLHASNKERQILEELLAGMEIVLPQRETAFIVGQLRARYDLSLGDAFVAALAVEQQLQLVTLNKKDFLPVKELELYMPSLVR